MIKISYEPDKHDNVDSIFGNGKCEICFDDEAVLTAVLYGFIKVCEFAGYCSESFDNILEEYDKEESFKDYCMDCVDSTLYY